MYTIWPLYFQLFLLTKLKLHFFKEQHVWYFYSKLKLKHFWSIFSLSVGKTRSNLFWSDLILIPFHVSYNFKSWTRSCIIGLVYWYTRSRKNKKNTCYKTAITPHFSDPKVLHASQQGSGQKIIWKLIKSLAQLCFYLKCYFWPPCLSDCLSVKQWKQYIYFPLFSIPLFW